MELSPDIAAAGPLVSRQRHSGVAVETITFTVLYSVVFAACGGFVFYGSVRNAPEPGGYFEILWVIALVVLAVALLAFPTVLLVLGLIQLRQTARLHWGPATTWTAAVAASAATAFLNTRDFAQWFSAYHNGLGWTLPRPDWLPLFAAATQLALGATMILLVARPKLLIPCS